MPRLQKSGFPFGSTDNLSASHRVDLLVSSFSLLIYAGLVFGVGLGLRLVSEIMVSRTGGSLAGVEVGEALEPPDGDVKDERDEGDEESDNQVWAP